MTTYLMSRVKILLCALENDLLLNYLTMSADIKMSTDMSHMTLN